MLALGSETEDAIDLPAVVPFILQSLLHLLDIVLPLQLAEKVMGEPDFERGCTGKADKK
jgi:hypothetical protein